jgi:drug/metabolite transporter (DMT)-like permease
MTNGARREKIIGVVCGLIVVVIWSGFLVLSRHGATGILTPYDLTALRFGVAGLIMLPVLLRNGFGGLKPGQVVVITVTAGPCFALFAYGGFSLAPTAHGAVLIPGVLPLFTAVLAMLVIKETFGPSRKFSLALTLCGIGLMAKESLTFSSSAQGWGDVLFLGASMSWAIFSVFVRAWRIAPLQATAIVTVLSMVGYLPIYVLFLPANLLIAPVGEVFLQGIFQGFLSLIVAMLAFTRTVAALGPAVTTMITAAVPGAAALAAIPLLHEPVSATAGVGIIFVTLGMVGAVVSIRNSHTKTA